MPAEPAHGWMRMKRRKSLIRVYPCLPPCASVFKKTFFFPKPAHARRIAISMLGRMMEAAR